MTVRQVLVLLLFLLLVPSGAASEDDGGDETDDERGCRLYTINDHGIQLDPTGCLRAVLDDLPPILGGPF